MMLSAALRLLRRTRPAGNADVGRGPITVTMKTNRPAPQNCQQSLHKCRAGSREIVGQVRDANA
jgi:hypothetical protein